MRNLLARNISARTSAGSHLLAPQWIGWLAGFAAFVLYAYTAAPGIVTFFDDSLEFQTVAPTFGIAHPTGYPLYTILGGVWTRLLPFGTWAGRLNLFSAFCAAITVGLVATLTSRIVTRLSGTDRMAVPNLWAGLAAATFFALGPVWWSQATIAEVYALHGVFVAAILSTTTGINQSPHFDQRMTLLMLLFGFGLTHHRTTALLVPPVALYLLWSVPDIWRPRRIWWQWAAALLLPLLLYLYIPLRAASGIRDLNGSYQPGWSGFWEHILARRYGAFFEDNALSASLTAGDWLDLVVSQSGWLGLALAAIGVVWLFDRRWRPARAWWLVMGVLLINLIFAILYRVPDPEVFLLPSLLCLAIFAGGGVGLLARLLPHSAASLLSVILITLVVLLPFGRGPIVNRRHDWRAHDEARRLAQADFPPGSVVVGLEGEMTALLYMQVAEGLGLNATPITANDPTERRAVVEAKMAEGVPLYLTRELEGISDLYTFSGEAGLIRVWPRGESQIDLPQAAATQPGLPLLLDENRVQIEGYQLRPIEGLHEEALELTLYWRVLSPTDKTLKLSLRVVDAEGTPYQWPADPEFEARPAVEDRFPLYQTAYTPSWLPGEMLKDVHTIYLPPTVETAKRQNGSSILLVIIYDSATALEEGRIEIMF